MNEILRKFTMGKPKQVVSPAAWIFIENFFISLPAILIYFVVTLLIEGFNNPSMLALDQLWMLTGAMGVFFVIQVVLCYLTFRKTYLPGARHSAENKKEFVRKLRTLPLGFFMNKKPGELINTFTGDFLAIEQSMVGGFVGLFSVAFGTIISCTFLVLFNPPMGMALYISLPVALIAIIASLRLNEKLTTDVREAKDRTANNLNEYLLGMKTLKAFNQTGTGFTKLESAYRQVMRVCIRAEVIGGSLLSFANSLVQLGLPLMCFVGAYLILGGSLGLAEYLGLIIIGTKVLAPVITWIQYMVLIKTHYVSAKRIDKVMQEQSMPGAQDAEATCALRFEHVSFSYSQEAQTVLHDVSFAVPANRLTAIVGPSGGGKTTILRLIARFWDVDAGQIVCGDTPLSSLDSESWFKNISMVLQDVYLFHETIRENILFGRGDATEDEMIEAAKRAQCHDFIMELPEQYDTLVGEGGSTLSGGEKQRISIARALLKDAPILLLDEPTSSLDARNEVKVQQALNELVKGRTVVMIAHRLKTVQSAHQILVLQDGAITEQGTHGALLRKKGLYHRLWNMQNASTEWNLETST